MYKVKCIKDPLHYLVMSEAGVQSSWPTLKEAEEQIRFLNNFIKRQKKRAIKQK